MGYLFILTVGTLHTTLMAKQMCSPFDWETLWKAITLETKALMGG